MRTVASFPGSLPVFEERAWDEAMRTGPMEFKGQVSIIFKHFIVFFEAVALFTEDEEMSHSSSS